LSTSTGNALAMKLKLRTLMQRHGVRPNPVKIPLLDAVDHPMLLEGYCSTDDVDHERCKFRPYAFGYPLRKSCRAVPLLYRHDPNQVAGEIVDLEYDELGNLQVWTKVTHPLAKRTGAFSIGATILDYTICDADSPDFYALVTQAELTEISLTDNPSNPFALVMDRHRHPPAVETLELLTAKMKILQKMTLLLKEI
jgi:Caudovirus prohead serine protease